MPDLADDQPNSQPTTRNHGRRRPRRRWLDGAILLLSAAAIAGGIWWTRSTPVDWYATELEPFRAAYGPGRHSFAGEEWFVRDFFRDRRNGIFVDVGAYDYRRDSNTYYLDTALNWSGIAVDANADFAADYSKHRPRTRFLTFFVSDRSDDRARLYIPKAFTPMASGDRGFAGMSAPVTEVRDVPTVTLNDLLAAAKLDHVDFVSIDVELSEPKVLAGFDINRYRPTLVCIEAQPQVRQQILDYFARAGYVVVGRYLRADLWNLWFTPLATN